METLKKQFLLFNDHGTNENLDFVMTNKMMIYEKFENIDFDKANIFILQNIIWKHDAMNYRLPHINGEKINYIKLCDNDCIYDYISSTSLIDDNDIISGEKITSLAQVFIGKSNSLIANPNVNQFINNRIDMNLISNIDMYNIIFIKTDDILDFYTKFDINNKIIITHNSDYEINQQYIKHIDKCKIQLSQNCLFKHNNLISLPIGIENSQWFDHSILNKIRTQKNIKKDKNVYFFFSLDTHLSRIECYKKLKNKLMWNVKLSKEEYFIELKRHKYAICPRGNGLDTHRLWECLYLDVIPIMLKKDAINIDNLPIIYLDDWNDYDECVLVDKFEKIYLSKITLNYYKNIINNA